MGAYDQSWRHPMRIAQGILRDGFFLLWDSAIPSSPGCPNWQYRLQICGGCRVYHMGHVSGCQSASPRHRSEVDRDDAETTIHGRRRIAGRR